MPKSTVHVKGLSSLRRKLAAIPPGLEREVSQELRNNIGPDALGEMVKRAPVEEGTLRGSHSMHSGGERVMTGADLGETAPDATPADGGQGSDDLSVVFVANTVYAVAQHERTDFAHPMGGEAKWMERVLTENAPQYTRAIGRAVKRELARIARERGEA